jgi:2-haloacid dehalogenase
MDFERFSVLTFDCYGTLIDWERGILDALAPILRVHGVAIEAFALLEAFAQLESEIEAGPYLN